MPGCSADYCTNSTKKKFKMCRFPKDVEKRTIWAENCNRSGLVATTESRLCEA